MDGWLDRWLFSCGGLEEGGGLNVLGWFMVLMFFIFLYAVTTNGKHDSFGMFS